MRKTFHKIKTKLSHKIYLHKTKKEGIPNRTGKKKIMTTETRVKENILKNCMINNNNKKQQKTVKHENVLHMSCDKICDIPS